MKRILQGIIAGICISIGLSMFAGVGGGGGGGGVGGTDSDRTFINSVSNGLAAGTTTAIKNLTNSPMNIAGPLTVPTLIVDIVTNRTDLVVTTNMTIQGSLIVANTGVLTNLGRSAVSNLLVMGTLNVDGTTTLTNCVDGATSKSLATIGQLNATNALCLRLTGGTMSGAVDDGGNVITNSAVMAATWHYLTGNTNAVYGNARIGLDSNFSSGSNVVIQIYTTGGVWTNAQRFQEP